MYSFKSIVLFAAAFAVGVECSAVPAVAAAPLVAPAAVGYAQAIPQNIPPFASQVSVFNRAISPLIAAPLSAAVATPFAAPIAAPLPARIAAPFAASVAAPFAAPVAAPFAAPVAAPFAAPVAAPLGAPVAAPLAAPFAAPISAPYASYVAGPSPYAAPFSYSAPLLRAPYFAPAFVR